MTVPKPVEPAVDDVASEHVDAVVAEAPPLKPEQVELLNRVFRPAPDASTRRPA